MANAAEAYPRTRPQRRESQPDLKVVRGGNRSRQEPTLGFVHTLAFRFFCTVVVFMACMAVVRVGFSAATVSTLMTSQDTTSKIQAAYAAGSDLEVQRSVLASPSRIQAQAEALGMQPATSVSYLDVSGTTDVQKVGAISDTTCSLAAAVSQITAATSTQTASAGE